MFFREDEREVEPEHVRWLERSRINGPLPARFTVTLPHQAGVPVARQQTDCRLGIGRDYLGQQQHPLPVGGGRMRSKPLHQCIPTFGRHSVLQGMWTFLTRPKTIIVLRPAQGDHVTDEGCVVRARLVVGEPVGRLLQMNVMQRRCHAAVAVAIERSFEISAFHAVTAHYLVSSSPGAEIRSPVSDRVTAPRIPRFGLMS